MAIYGVPGVRLTVFNPQLGGAIYGPTGMVCNDGGCDSSSGYIETNDLEASVFWYKNLFFISNNLFPSGTYYALAPLSLPLDQDGVCAFLPTTAPFTVYAPGCAVGYYPCDGDAASYPNSWIYTQGRDIDPACADAYKAACPNLFIDNMFISSQANI